MLAPAQPLAIPCLPGLGNSNHIALRPELLSTSTLASAPSSTTTALSLASSPLSTAVALLLVGPPVLTRYPRGSHSCRSLSNSAPPGSRRPRLHDPSLRDIHFVIPPSAPPCALRPSLTTVSWSPLVSRSRVSDSDSPAAGHPRPAIAVLMLHLESACLSGQREFSDD
jgi:hypothetical protein